MEKAISIDKTQTVGPLLRLFFKWSYIDWFGGLVAFLCALHCFSLPFLTLILPLNSLSSLGILFSPQATWSMAFFSLFMGFYSLLHGYLHHHAKRSVFVFFLLGFGLLFFDKFTPSLHGHWTALGGGLCLTYAHFLNWRFSRSHNIACSCSLTVRK